MRNRVYETYMHMPNQSSLVRLKDYSELLSIDCVVYLFNNSVVFLNA